jgi:hypothetical protein
MDDKRFDAFAQTLSDGATRRAAFRLVSGGALATVLGWRALSEDSEAKRKRKKKSKKKPRQRCPSDSPTYCPPDAHNPDGLCVPAGFHCCGSALGSGACEGAYPQCCPPTAQDPQGLCIETGSVCCTTEEGGGYCGPGQTCCPPCAGWPDGFCANPGYSCLLGCKSGFASDGSSGGYSARKTDAAKRSAGR